MAKTFLASLILLAQSVVSGPETGTGTSDLATVLTRNGDILAAQIDFGGVLMDVWGEDAAAASETTVTSSDTVMTTTVKDEAHPDEPVVVTTNRRVGETAEQMINRHLDTVAAVRKALNKPSRSAGSR